MVETEFNLTILLQTHSTRVLLVVNKWDRIPDFKSPNQKPINRPLLDNLINQVTSASGLEEPLSDS